MKKIFLFLKFVLKKNSKYVDNVTFNESIECSDVEFHFRKKIKNHGFLIGSISEFFLRKKINRRVLYCNGEEEYLSLKSIQMLSRLYSLPPPYPFCEDPQIPIKNIPVMNSTLHISKW